jgi:hypothetical protein
VTVRDLRCDICGRALVAPASSGDAPPQHSGVAFAYHPGEHRLGDKSGLLCEGCAATTVAGLDPERPFNRCAVCGVPVRRTDSLHVTFGGDPNAWQLCATHAVRFLNRLRTVAPKLDPAEFRFPLAAQEDPDRRPH